jgi:hypothetical protein
MKFDSFFVGIFCGAFLLCNMVFAGDPINSGEPIKQTEKTEMPIQVTVISPLGTNGVMATQFSNRISFNIFAGVNGGVNGFEIGGFTNGITGSVRGVQMAGFGNYVHQEIDGAQVAGFFNIGRSNVNGGQFGGFFNLSLQNMRGAQVAGFANVNHGTMEGFQGAGAVNISTGEANGFQVAGLANYTGGDATMGQGAGMMNIALGNTNSMQISGLLNLSGGSHNGLQATGLVNIAKEEVRGAQISGGLNYTRKLRGLQLGIINIADSVESGAMIGLFNYARNGYMSIQVSSDESFHGLASFRMGLRNIYTIYSVGFAALEEPVWAYAFGLGTYLAQSERIGLTLEGSTFHLHENRRWSDELNMLVRLNINLQYNMTNRFSIVGGISGNLSISQRKDEEGQLKRSLIIPDWTFYQHASTNTETFIYPGYHLGLKYTIK